MGAESKIEWTDATWNPWHGCHKISPGCKNCYMFRDKERYGQDPNVVVRSKTKFTEPLKWKGPKVIFTCSWSDWFIEEADVWREDAYGVIRGTPGHTYQILTKRSERIAGRFPDPALANAWLGVSVESPQYKYRIDHLRAVPATIRFLSLEPLLVDLGELDLAGIHWVIAGGESGPDARPMHPDWVRSIREQCVAAGVAFHFKQWGEWAPGENVDRQSGTIKTAKWLNNRWHFGSENLANHDGHIDDEPDLYRVGKKAAGRLLDGQTWDQFPGATK